ncbi:MAG: hypothetical protein AAGE01_09055 [Pseudomonadota bacterium]
MKIEKEVEFRTRMGRRIIANVGRPNGSCGYACRLDEMRSPDGPLEVPSDFPTSALGMHAGDAVLTFKEALNLALARLWPHDGVTEIAQADTAPSLYAAQ